MKHFLAISLCFLVPALVFAGDKDGFKVAYDGGSMENIKTGKSLHLSIQDQKIQLSDKKETLVTIPATSVTEISYGQDVHRRIGTAIGLAGYFCPTPRKGLISYSGRSSSASCRERSQKSLF